MSGAATESASDFDPVAELFGNVKDSVSRPRYWRRRSRTRVGFGRRSVARLDQPDDVALVSRKPLNCRDQFRFGMSRFSRWEGWSDAKLATTRLRKPDPEQIRNRKLHPSNPVPVLPLELQRSTHCNDPILPGQQEQMLVLHPSDVVIHGDQCVSIGAEHSTGHLLSRRRYRSNDVVLSVRLGVLLRNPRHRTCR
jgi:hypothetical protein